MAKCHLPDSPVRASIKYLRNILGLFDPLPPLYELATDLYYEIHANSLTSSAFDLDCVHTLWMPPSSAAVGGESRAAHESK